MPPVVDPRPLRWLIAAPLSPSPAGRRVTVSGERFSTVMESLSPSATVTVSDRLGSDDSRTFELAIGRPRDLRTKHTISKLTLLQALSEAADRLAKDGDVAAAVKRITATVGPGRLVDALQGRTPAATVRPQAPASPPPSPAAVAADDDDDDDDPIFGRAAVAAPAQTTAAEAKSAVGSFVSAIRSTTPTAKTTATAVQARSAATLIHERLQATARDVLATEPLAGLERAWRSIRMVMAASPGSDDLGVDAVDIDTEGLVATLRTQLDGEAWRRADAVFVVQPIDDPAVLTELAGVAEHARVPIVVEVPAAMVGLSSADSTLDETPEAWTALRSQPGMEWICAVVGKTVLAQETDGGSRLVFGGGTAAVAAMAAASVGSSGTPANIVGKGGALVAPAAHRFGSQTIPTETFTAYATQQALAERGVLALGSEADSDRLRLSAAPMLSGAASLPGRVLAGRAHRLAVAVRQALGAGASATELARALDEASGVFLPRVPAGAVTLRVRDASADGLKIDASIGAALAGASVTFSSDV